MKPENILIQNNGYIKLTDFGFVKKVTPWERTYTLCGTPEYMAPEVIQNIGHGRAADWYTLGILIYELIVGRPPFSSNDPYQTLQMIQKEPIVYPKGFGSDAKSLVKHLTDHNLTRRYGNLVGGPDDIRNHRFFKEVDFKSLVKMSSKAPICPSRHAANVSENEKGLKLSSIPESMNNKLAPEISNVQDCFQKWF